MILDGSTPVSVTKTLASNTEEIIEATIDHNTAGFLLTIQFGTQGDLCRKMLQDITIYA